MKAHAALALALALALAAASAPTGAQVSGNATQDSVVSAKGLVDLQEIDAAGEIVIHAPQGRGSRAWRFWIRVPDAKDDAVLRDLAGQGAPLAPPIDRRDLRRGTWSPYLRKDAVLLNHVRGEVDIPAVAMQDTGILPQTPVGTLKLDPVNGRTLDLEMNQLVRSVGYLSVLNGSLPNEPTGEEKRFFTYCTAFLIAPDLALTAAHCVEDGLDGRFAELVLGYVLSSHPDGAGRHGVSLLGMSRPHDLAALRLDPPADVVRTFEIAPCEAAAGTELLVLQHFGGDPMSISDDSDCEVTADTFSGGRYFIDGKTVEVPDLAAGHRCDTTLSSSGSPVLDRLSYKVALLHHRGFQTTSGEPKVNRGVRSSTVARFAAAAIEANTKCGPEMQHDGGQGKCFTFH